MYRPLRFADFTLKLRDLDGVPPSHQGRTPVPSSTKKHPSAVPHFPFLSACKTAPCLTGKSNQHFIIPAPLRNPPPTPSTEKPFSVPSYRTFPVMCGATIYQAVTALQPDRWKPHLLDSISGSGENTYWTSQNVLLFIWKPYFLPFHHDTRSPTNVSANMKGNHFAL